MDQGEQREDNENGEDEENEENEELDEELLVSGQFWGKNIVPFLSL